MGAGHAHLLHIHGHSVVHRLAPQVKVVAVLAFAVAVVTAPREAFWIFAVAALAEVAVVRLAGLPLGRMARRLVLGAPFVAFAVLLPVVGVGERTDVLGIPLSVEGLWAAWNILAKATLGLGATLILTATTEVPELLAGLDRLRMPAIVTAIAGFMVRYLDVLGDGVRRMRLARLARAGGPRWYWQAGAVAATAGTLFVRSYERGERVYLAMRSRGFDGTFPAPSVPEAPIRQWAGAMALPAVMASCAAAALWL